jgi:hypothetical protein
MFLGLTKNDPRFEDAQVTSIDQNSYQYLGPQSRGYHLYFLSFHRQTLEALTTLPLTHHGLSAADVSVIELWATDFHKRN